MTADLPGKITPGSQWTNGTVPPESTGQLPCRVEIPAKLASTGQATVKLVSVAGSGPTLRSTIRKET